MDDFCKELLKNHLKIKCATTEVGKFSTCLERGFKEDVRLSSDLSYIALLAITVSDKVKRLDTARNKVSECQQRVHDLIDLQLCCDGVVKALKVEDFEKGAAHINRFLSIDKALLRKTACEMSESISSVSFAVMTLENAAQELKVIITNKFQDAVVRDDLSSIERYFKIFPLLKMHDEGVTKFFSYICIKLGQKAQKVLQNSVECAKSEKRISLAFADTLTIVLEHFARVIKVNRPLLELSYGFGHLFKALTIFQVECDAQVKRVIDEFNHHRQLSRILAIIQEQQKNSVSSSSLAHSRKPSGGSIEKLEMKELDGILNELVIMHSRADLYIKFAKRQVKNDLESSGYLENESKVKILEMEDFFNRCGLTTRMQELIASYLTLESYFLRESILKAIVLDTYEDGQHYSSIVDDVFFIIKKSIKRAIATQSLDCVCAVINNSLSCLEQHYLTALQNHLKSGFLTGYMDLTQAYNAFQNTLQQGRFLISNEMDQTKTNFFVQLNNTDKSITFIETLAKSCVNEINETFPNNTQKDTDILESCVNSLKAFSNSLKAVINSGIQKLRSSFIKPRVHPWIDNFLTHNYNISEDELTNSEANGAFMQLFILKLDGLLSTLKKHLNEHNYNKTLDMVVIEVATRLERVIRKQTFNRVSFTFSRVSYRVAH